MYRVSHFCFFLCFAAKRNGNRIAFFDSFDVERNIRLVSLNVALNCCCNCDCKYFCCKVYCSKCWCWCVCWCRVLLTCVVAIALKGTVSRDLWSFFCLKDSTLAPYERFCEFFRFHENIRSQSSKIACLRSYWLRGHATFSLDREVFIFLNYCYWVCLRSQRLRQHGVCVVDLEGEVS